MRIIAITNQKGGVGKTTTSVNLGACLAERGRRVLLIDLDPQGNLSTHVGVDIYGIERSLYDVLTQDAALADVVHETGVANLFCAPSNIDLSGAEVEMVTAVGRETILKEAIQQLAQGLSPADAFDFVLIDCPPSLGLLCINALAAADEILIPMQTEFFALQGMSKLMEVVAIVKKRINPRLHVGGIVACRMDTRTRLSAEVLDDIAAHFPDLLYDTRIRQNVKLAEAPSFGQTIVEYAFDSNGAADYRDLAAEMLGEPRVHGEAPGLEHTAEHGDDLGAADEAATDDTDVFRDRIRPDAEDAAELAEAESLLDEGDGSAGSDADPLVEDRGAADAGLPAAEDDPDAAPRPDLPAAPRERLAEGDSEACAPGELDRRKGEQHL